jgi:hypothetical protein
MRYTGPFPPPPPAVVYPSWLYTLYIAIACNAALYAMIMYRIAEDLLRGPWTTWCVAELVLMSVCVKMITTVVRSAIDDCEQERMHTDALWGLALTQ